MEQNQQVIGHETEDASVVGVLRAGAGLAVGVVLSCAIAFGVFKYFVSHPVAAGEENPMAETGQSQYPPAPRIEERPALEVKSLRAQEERILSTYGWSDKKAGVVRIPIERAMQLQLERGFRTTKEPAK